MNFFFPGRLCSEGWQHILWDDAAAAAAVAAGKTPVPRKKGPSSPAAGAGTADTPAYHTAAAPGAAGGLPREPPRPPTVGLRLANWAAFESAGNFGEKSDILRYEILLQVRARLRRSGRTKRDAASVLYLRATDSTRRAPRAA